MSDAYGRRVDEALAYVADAFRGITRKGTSVPYLTHLLAVAALAGEAGGDEDQILAALLHDVLEDVPGSSEADLAARFGPRVAGFVVALSDTTETPKPPWRPRKEAYLAHLRDESADLKLVSACDKLHNCRSLVRDLRRFGPSTLERFTGKRDGTVWYYEQIVDALAANDWDHWLLGELRREVTALRQLAYP